MPRSLDCQEVLDRIEAYADGDLEGATAAAVAAHLESCSACAGEHRLALDVRRELRALPSFDAPPAVLREVFRQVGRERFRPPARAGRPASTGLVWAAAAAAVLAAAVVGGGVLLTLRSAAPSAPATAELAPAPAPADSEEIARATAEARLAFAHVARVSRQAGFQVRDDLGEHLVAAPARSLTRALFAADEPDPAAGEDRGAGSDRS